MDEASINFNDENDRYIDKQTVDRVSKELSSIILRQIGLDLGQDEATQRQ